MSGSPDAGSSTEARQNNSAEISQSSGQARILNEQIKSDISGIKSDVGSLKDSRHEDFVKILFMYGGGFLLLAGMIVTSYLMLDGKISTINDLSIKVDTKLEELIKRIPPVPTPVPTPAPAQTPPHP